MFDVQENKAYIHGSYGRVYCVRNRPRDGLHIGALQEGDPLV
jgi:hypothetical protein